jgi:hypothetical protein
VNCDENQRGSVARLAEGPSSMRTPMARNSSEATRPKPSIAGRLLPAAKESSFGHCEKSLALTRPLPVEWAGSLEITKGTPRLEASQASWTLLAQVARGWSWALLALVSPKRTPLSMRVRVEASTFGLAEEGTSASEGWSWSAIFWSAVIRPARSAARASAAWVQSS